MAVEMVLNDLSVRVPARDVYAARERMQTLIDTIRAATTSRVARVLRTSSNLQDMEISPGYSFVQWRNDSMVDRETRLFFKTLAAKSPYLDDILDRDLLDQATLTEGFFEGEIALGLAAAYSLDALALSLLSEECWNSAVLQVTIRAFDETDNLSDQDTDIMHASRSDHVREHLSWIGDRLTADIQDGHDLWTRKETLFPDLIFCAAVGASLTALFEGDSMLRPIIKRLEELQFYCRNWHGGPFDPSHLPSKVSPESEATLENFPGSRTFRCPDGENRVFSWHARLTPLPWRLHFFPCNGKIIVGYIGKHLPTVGDPT